MPLVLRAKCVLVGKFFYPWLLGGSATSKGRG